MRASFRGAFGIREEYRERTVFKIENFRTVAGRPASRKREVALEVSAPRNDARTFLGVHGDELTSLGERPGIEFDDPYRKRSVSGYPDVSFRNFAETNVRNIGIMGILIDDREGFGGIPKSVLPSGSKTDRSDDARPRVGIVIEMARRVSDRARGSGSEVVGIEISVEIRKIGWQFEADERGIRVRKSARERLGNPRGVHVERIRVRSGGKCGKTFGILEDERDSGRRGRDANQASTQNGSFGRGFFDRRSFDGSAENDVLRTSATGYEPSSVRIRRNRPSESGLGLGREVLRHFRIVGLKPEVLKKDFGLGKVEVSKSHRQNGKEYGVSENVRVPVSKIGHGLRIRR